jgi:hypothetical protein
LYLISRFLRIKKRFFRRIIKKHRLLLVTTMKTTTMTLLVALMAIDVSAETTVPYKACAIPSFEWATYSTSTTARMYGMRGAYSAGSIYAAGFVKSTIDAGMATMGKFTLQGPYTLQDPSGIDSKSLSVNMKSYTTTQGAKENAGGTWGQYDVGVAKIDAVTGTPQALFTWEGDGLDETTGVAVQGSVLAVSGHFTGNLTAILKNGTSSTIWNSNIENQVSGVADNADQFHPNTKDVSGHSGVDDGFVIRADANTGMADWIVRYPESNKDAQIIDVDISDSEEMGSNVLVAGYRCAQEDGADSKTCDGIVAMLSGVDGSVLWEQVLTQVAAVLRIKYDPQDHTLYATGTTTFSGFTDKDNNKVNPLCEHATCSVVIRMSAMDGNVEWERTLQGSPRWGVFGQNGGVGLAAAADGPYVYVAVDDTGEDAATSLDAGSPYSGCQDVNGVITPEYLISATKLVTSEDCPEGSTFIPRDSEEALAASTAQSGAMCGDANVGQSCVMKYHKYTGLPIWSHDAPEVSGMVPSVDGKSVHIGGWYSSRGGIPTFGEVKMPEYLREQGLDGKTGGVYNAKINAATGIGEYAISSGGGTKDRLNDVVGDENGNIYNIGYHQNLVMRWGNELKTQMEEDDGMATPNSDNPTQAVETQICVSKMTAAVETIPSCLTSCSGSTDDATIDANSCFIDGKCYPAGGSTNAFGQSCYICSPAVSQREWTEGPTIGAASDDGMCVIGGTCIAAGQEYFYQRRAWNSPRVMSECRVCDPVQNVNEWSVKDGYTFNATAPIPPADCVADKVVVVLPPSKEEEEKEETPALDEKDDVARGEANEVSDSLGAGAIIGIVLGSIAVASMVAAVVTYNKKKGKNDKELDQEYDPNIVDDKSSIASGV